MQDLALRAINRVVLLQIAKGVTVDHVPVQFAGCPQPFKAMFLDGTMLRRFSKDSENLLAEDFLDEALSKGDQCYAILDSKGALAAYGWYARPPTTMDPADLRLSFDQHYVCMHKGYTHTHHRARRLHAIGMIGVLQ
jgi:hypothetical protein